MSPSSHSLLRLLLVAAGCAFSTAPAAAQCTQLSVPGQPNDGFGRALATAGDVDADGFPDVMIYARSSNFSGAYVEVRSGRTSAVLHRFDYANYQTVNPGMAGLGDVNGDGHDDFAIGDPWHDIVGTPQAGRVRAYDGATGSMILEVTGGEFFGYFGAALAGVGDVDGDGVPDLAVGEPGNNQNGGLNGAAYVYSGANGALLRSGFGELRDHFGATLCAVGDVDADGVPDLLVGAPREDGAYINQGGAWALSGADFTPLQHVTGWADDDLLGTSLAAVGDWDGDGHADFAVGAPAAFSGGVVVVVSGATGQNLAWLNGGYGGSGYGAALAAGDFDGDAALELAVGMSSNNTTGPGAGSVKVHDGPSGVLIEGFTGPGQFAFFGAALAMPGDCDGDGRGELIIGVPGSNAGGQYSGEVVAVLCGRMSLLPPAPGIAGQPNQFSVRGVNPGTTITFYASLALGSSPLPGCPGSSLALGGARTAFGSAVADPLGEARVTVTVPAAAHGVGVLLQAADHAACETTAPLVAVFF